MPPYREHGTFPIRMSRCTPHGETPPAVLDADETDENARPHHEIVEVGIEEAARIAGVSQHTMQRRVREGMFPEARRDRTERGHPWRISRSVVLEVGQVRKRTPRQERVDIEGELAAAAFQLFESAVDLVQVVIRLKAQPEAISKLHDQWLALRAKSPPPATPPAPAAPAKPIDWNEVNK